MAQGQLPIGWHAWKVESKKEIYRTILELSYFNKTINNEVNKIADRCLHCGTTLHWHLKTTQCPLYDKKDECKIHGIFQRKSNRKIKLLIKNLKNLKEEQRKQRQNSNKKVKKNIKLFICSKMIVKSPFWMKSMKMKTSTGRVRMRKVQQKLLKVR